MNSTSQGVHIALLRIATLGVQGIERKFDMPFLQYLIFVILLVYFGGSVVSVLLRSRAGAVARVPVSYQDNSESGDSQP